jgi:hypothetical protein
VNVGYFNLGLHKLLCGAGNLGEIWSACGQYEIEYTDRRMLKYMYNYVYNFTCVFLYIMCNKNTNYWEQEKFCKNYNSQPSLGCRYY